MIAPSIRLSGTVRFGAAQILRSGQLDLVAGGLTCLLGPSGSGKSTLLRLIAGLRTGATFDGEIEASDGGPLTGRIAYMAQDDLLLPWLDTRSNVALGARLRADPPEHARVTALIARLGLEACADRRPATLSGGQRQRVALARTLMEDRPIVLLDEPFSALDARTRADMQELAIEMLAGRTVLLVTHEPSEAARLADAIWLLEDGRLQAHAPPPGHPPRPADAPQTLSHGAALLARLRAGA